MKNVRIYFVRREETTPEEPLAGFYISQDSEVIYGPFLTRDAALAAIDEADEQILAEGK
jgi:hypothetical protein